jgi:hypothetical protein
VYKWLEAVAYELSRRPEPELKRTAEATISLIEEAQDPDGYINTYFQLAEPGKRWTDLTRAHELYCAGHLFEAAIAYKRFLGWENLLAVALRFADHIATLFGPNGQHGTGGHPEIEMALVELYRETGEKRYLDLAQFFVDQRGYESLPLHRITGHGGSGVYQDHIPVREASTLEGHAVRQLYLTGGVTDLVLETGEQELMDAIHRQWHDMVSRKMYFTGGLGQNHTNEAFGEPYDLPNGRAYCETCAAIAGIMWNWRLLLAEPDRTYADLIEHALYNAVLSGVALDGKSFFYVNPLRATEQQPVIGRKQVRRMDWPWTPCCPPNIMRLFSLLEHFLATTDGYGLHVHQFMSATVETRLKSAGDVALRIRTDYPWSNTVRLEINNGGSGEWPIHVRLPGWSQHWVISVNDAPTDEYEERNGYAILSRSWKKGDTLTVELDLTPSYYQAHPYVDATRGSVAIKRGPVVYCLEQEDQDTDVDLRYVVADPSKPLASEWRPDLLGGVFTVAGKGFKHDVSHWGETLYRRIDDVAEEAGEPIQVTAIPYYAWANREVQPMRVWIPRTDAK